MKEFWKWFLIVLLIAIVALALFIGFCCLCKRLDILPKLVDWLGKIFDSMNVKFFGKILPIKK